MPDELTPEEIQALYASGELSLRNSRMLTENELKTFDQLETANLMKLMPGGGGGLQALGQVAEEVALPVAKEGLGLLKKGWNAVAAPATGVAGALAGKVTAGYPGMYAGWKGGQALGNKMKFAETIPGALPSTQELLRNPQAYGHLTDAQVQQVLGAGRNQIPQAAPKPAALTQPKPPPAPQAPPEPVGAPPNLSREGGPMRAPGGRPDGLQVTQAPSQGMGGSGRSFQPSPGEEAGMNTLEEIGQLTNGPGARTIGTGTFKEPRMEFPPGADKSTSPDRWKQLADEYANKSEDPAVVEALRKRLAGELDRAATPKTQLRTPTSSHGTKDQWNGKSYDTRFSSDAQNAASKARGRAMKEWAAKPTTQLRTPKSSRGSRTWEESKKAAEETAAENAQLRVPKGKK